MAKSIEIGRIGQKRYGGTFYEEFLAELRGGKGVEVYREMSENDDVVGAILYAIEMLIRQASWRVDPSGDTPKDKEAAEFVESCLHDMQDTWTDTLSEILTFLTYGWSYHEIVYKRRMGRTKNPATNSKYNDGLIGWRKLPIRSQETLYQWEYDNEDNLLGMTQQPPPDFGMFTVPIEKAMLFRTKSRKGNPEGRSILRNAYRSWYFKKRIQEYEGIGIERDLAGMPVFTAPEGLDIWNSEDPEMVKIKAAMDTIVSGIRQDAIAGIVKPAGYEFQLVSSAGTKQFDTNAIINRYDTRIAMTVLADFIFLGHQQVGSFALSSDKTELFSTAIGAYLNIICETFNQQGIPRLIDINGEHFNGITDYPRLEHGDIEDVDISKVGDFISKMAGIGALMADDALEDYIREIGHLPERTGTDTRNAQARRDDASVERWANSLDGADADEDEDVKERLEPERAELGKYVGNLSLKKNANNDTMEKAWNEGDHPRDARGRFTSGGGGSSGGSAYVSSGGTSPTSANEFEVKGFRSKQALNNHYANHVVLRHEYDNDKRINSKEDYQKVALDLVQSKVGGDIYGHLDKDGNVVRYDAKHNDFVKGKPDKGVMTMYKPKESKLYYNRIKEGDVEHGGQA